MSRVYLAIPGAPDELLGHVKDDGGIYHSQAGPDKEIGHVDLAMGDIYEHRFGPDKKVGHVDLGSGKVYATRLGPDAYVRQDASSPGSVYGYDGRWWHLQNGSCLRKHAA